MAQILVCFILAQVFVAAAMASTSFDASSSGPSPSPAQAPKRVTQSARKLGAPSSSPSSDSDSGHSAETDDHSGKEKMHSPNTSVDEEAAALLESKSGSDHRHPFDKSVAGGGVILGGLATTFLVAIFCYIRATRRHSKAESPAHQLP